MNSTLHLLYDLYLSSTGISTDTRKIKEGNIFFALKGPSFNGNEYAALALEKGALAVVVDEKPENLEVSDIVVLVRGVLETLQKLAVFHRSKLDARIIGITGSNGKTTTKELLYSILKKVEKETYCTHGNLNNHIGVPLSLLRVPLSAKYAIIEMGTNQPGDIAELCSFSQPDYGIITNIGKAHLEKLKSQQGVFEEKIGLLEAVKRRNGTFFINDGDQFLGKIDYENGVRFSSKHTLNYDISVLAQNLTLSFQLSNESNTYTVNTGLFGSYNIENIAAALTIAEYFSIPTEEAITAIEEYSPSNMRSQIIHTDKNTILLDAYNSNPFSLNESLTHFINADVENKVAIIGDMLELGDHAQSEHQKIVEKAKELSEIDFYFVGDTFYEFQDQYSAQFYKNVEEMMIQVNALNISDSNVLIKGSRGIKLEKLLDHL